MHRGLPPIPAKDAGMDGAHAQDLVAGSIRRVPFRTLIYSKTRETAIGKETKMNAQAGTAKDEAVFASARRVNEALTARMEKRALQWMAERAPKWVSSDQLTLMGFCAQVGAGIFYGLSRYNRYALLLVILCLVLNWLGDSMDGTLARVRRQQRPRYGFYVDHMADIFGSVALMCGLGFSGFLQ